MWPLSPLSPLIYPVLRVYSEEALFLYGTPQLKLAMTHNRIYTRS